MNTGASVQVSRAIETTAAGITKEATRHRIDEMFRRFLAGATMHAIATDFQITTDMVSRALRRRVSSPAALEFQRLKTAPRPHIGGVVRIFRPNKMVAIVDAGDFHWIVGLSWSINDQGYLWNPANRKRLHRLLKPAPKSCIVDHENGNTLDNRTQNLRVTDKSGNCRNMRKTKRTRRGQFKGVCINRIGGHLRWVAQIAVGKHPDGRERRIVGRLRWTEEEAARDYDRLAIHHFDEFAATNFPRSDYESEAGCQLFREGTCLTCGAKYVAKRENKAYCSRRCGQQARKAARTP